MLILNSRITCEVVGVLNEVTIDVPVPEISDSFSTTSVLKSTVSSSDSFIGISITSVPSILSVPELKFD